MLPEDEIDNMFGADSVSTAAWMAKISDETR